MADAGGRFLVFSAAEVPPIRRGTNLVRRVRGGFRVGNFYSAKKIFCRIPPRRRSDLLGPTRTQADSIGVRRGIVPPLILPLTVKEKIVVSFCVW